ncbi:MAG: hypothetical protein MJ193_02605, partial [Clostridia bacterium]|nr:hypothetical protein [Clostridia bacterium]
MEENLTATKQKLTKVDILRRIVLHIPFVLLIAVALACIGGGLILVIYSFVAVSAVHSAMIFLILFGGGVLIVGIGLGAIEFFRIYLVWYNQKEKFIKPAPKTEVKKNPFSFANICFYIMLVGSVLAIISAALGSIKAENWIAARESYMAENGYYAESHLMNITYDIENHEINTINIDVDKKKVVIIYSSKNDGFVKINGYLKYENQISSACGSNAVSVNELPSPRLNRTKDKMLFFLFVDNEAEAQIQITIPEYYRDKITIN